MGFGVPLPVDKLQMARYEIGNPNPKDPLMVRDPGTPGPRLSNFGYMLVSLVVEKVTGARVGAFGELVRERVGRPLGATRIRAAATLVSDQPADEARYRDGSNTPVDRPPQPNEIEDELKLEPSVMSGRFDCRPNGLDERPLVPIQYGGFNVGALDAMGGLSVASVDFARILASLNLRTNNPVLDAAQIDTMLLDTTINEPIGWDWPHFADTKPPSAHRVKGGLLDGSQAIANFTQNGLAYVVVWARDGVVLGDADAETPGLQGWYPTFADLERAIGREFSQPASVRDRFPDFGMPSF